MYPKIKTVHEILDYLKIADMYIITHWIRD